jgi:hypothetical protein
MDLEDYLVNPTEWRRSWSIVADSSTKVELLPIDNDSRVPYAVNLPANEGSRELSCHSLRQIVDVENYFCHYQLNYY